MNVSVADEILLKGEQDELFVANATIIQGDIIVPLVKNATFGSSR